jgi:uncharacterized protein involved in exopolysaccharide biosynthesis
MATEPDSAPSPLRRRRTTKTAAPTSPPSTPASANGPPAETDPPRHRRPFNRRYLTIVALGSLAAGIVIGLLAALAARHTTPTFQSQALLEIDQPHTLAVSTDEGVIAKLSRLRYKYAGLIRTQTFAAPVAEKTDLPLATVATSLFVTVDPDTLVLALGARTHDRAQTQRIAAAGAQELIEYTRHEQSSLKVPIADQITWTLVTPASVPTRIAPTNQRSVLVGLGAFVFVTGGALAFGYLWRREY